MTDRDDQQVVFVCQHGAFRSRIAAACFNEAAPIGWRAISAGVTPQSVVSERLLPLLAGMPAADHADLRPPRAFVDKAGVRVVAIDAEVPGATLWRLSAAAAESDEELRDEIQQRVLALARELAAVMDPLAAIRWPPARPVLTVVECHAGGEIGNVVVAGVDPPPGSTVFEQMQQFRADDSLRRLLLREPRGSVAVHANVVLPSSRADCAFGYVIMEPTEYPAMSGSNTICVATVLIETGMVEMREPVTRLRLEAPGGPVDISAGCRAGKVEWVEFENVPCFAGRLDVPLEVPGLGTLQIDVAYGGMWYAIADAHALGFALEPSEARDLSRVGELIRVAAREQVDAVHPENPDIAGVSIVQIAEPWRGVGETSKNAVVVAPGRLDRSATGTGLSARIAALHARGLMRVGDTMTHASVIGSTFDGRIVREVTVAGQPAIVPAIRGSAWITGVTRVLVDPTDPFPEGYLMTDTWPGDDIQA